MSDPIVLPNSALLRVTGWPEATENGIVIEGLRVKTPWRPPEEPRRVEVICWPKTDRHGRIKHLYARKKAVRPAKAPNGATFRIVGHLLRADRHSSTIKIKVLPQAEGITPFVLHACATSAVVKAECATAAYVEAKGKVIAGDLLLIENMQQVHAPNDRWGLKRQKPNHPAG